MGNVFSPGIRGAPGLPRKGTENNRARGVQLILVWLGLVDHYLRVGLTGLVQLPGGRGGLILVTDVYGGCVPGIHQTCERRRVQRTQVHNGGTGQTSLLPF